VLAPTGTLYLHLDYREAHYAKVLLDGLFGRECFLNEIVWAYDYGARPRRRWPAKHDTILVYVKDPERYWFDAGEVEREPYMAPGLVTAEKAARGKLPTDVWWHTIVSPTGKEKTGYPTQKPEGIVRRMVQASTRPGDWCLDPFAGSGTLGSVCGALDRRFVLIDSSAEAVEVARRRTARFLRPDAGVRAATTS
jgi:site-specific DNA-methyltransferase (adenine-specific)